jgi:predicted ATPase
MRSHHGTVSLAPLDHEQVRHMVKLAARHALPTDVIEGVTERTGGVPLFVEELTRLLLERGEQGSLEVIPPTLQQSLTARLDRLGSAREVAQIGSVIGRDFSYPLIRSVHCATSSQPSRSCWHITLRKQASPKRPSSGGTEPDSGRCNARPCWKR